MPDHSRQFGNVNEQLDFVATQLANVTELQDGFDAIGFSQGMLLLSCIGMHDLHIVPLLNAALAGGQFLRAYIELYNTPPVNNLITFGSQHMGVSDLPLCSRWDLFCQLARRYAARGGVYTEWAQHNLVQVSRIIWHSTYRSLYNPPPPRHNITATQHNSNSI